MAVALAALELVLMHAESPEEFSELWRAVHVTAGMLAVALVWFVRLYLKAGRLWLAWLFTSLRVLIIVLAFSLQPSLNFTAITDLRQISIWGDTIVMPIGEKSPWANLPHFSGLLMIVFVMDAAVMAWRQGDRKRALVVGTTFGVTVLLGIGLSELMDQGVLPIPFPLSIVFLIIVVGMAIELSDDFLRARELSNELRESEKRMRLAAVAANIGIWELDSKRNLFWLNEKSRERLGVDSTDPITFDRYLKMLHPDDREATRSAMHRVLERGGDFQWEYRILTPDGTTRTMSALGQVESGGLNKPLLLRGVSVDITERKQSETERIALRNALDHLSRVMTMNELSGSLAHEINQPLGAILNNASVALMLVSQSSKESAELEEILRDIIADTRRAGDIIRKTRGMVKKGEMKVEQLDVNELIHKVVELYRNTLNLGQTSLTLELQPDLPPVRGDGIRLQQVLMNLTSNAIEAMNHRPSKRLSICSIMRDPESIIVSVSDSGPGIDASTKEKMFQQFFTTKEDGLGMGLSICRSIIEEHGGSIWAENNQAGGAAVSFTLKTFPGDTG
jgi:PAS domain S-box-containing protein